MDVVTLILYLLKTINTPNLHIILQFSIRCILSKDLSKRRSRDAPSLMRSQDARRRVSMPEKRTTRLCGGRSACSEIRGAAANTDRIIT